jgi:hypothetical protein
MAGGARGSLRAVFSDSIVKQPAFTRVIRRSHGGERRRPLRSGAGPAPSFPPPSPMRERSAGTAQVSTGHLTKAPACRVAGTRASRRSTAAIFYAVTVASFIGPETCISRYPGSIGAALHPKWSKPLKAGPSTGPDDDHAPWDGVTSPACRRRTLAPSTKRP